MFFLIVKVSFYPLQCCFSNELDNAELQIEVKGFTEHEILAYFQRFMNICHKLVQIANNFSQDSSMDKNN